MTGPQGAAILEAGRVLLSCVWVLPVEADASEAMITRGDCDAVLTSFSEELDAQWSGVEDFLVTNPIPAQRRVLGKSGDIGGGPVEILVGGMALPCGVIVSRHPRHQAISVILCTEVTTDATTAFEWSDVDTAVAVIRSFEGVRSDRSSAQGAQLVRGCVDGREFPSVRDALHATLTDRLGLSFSHARSRDGWCVELRGRTPCRPDQLVAAHPQPFYGLGTGDEGWRYVPEAVASRRLAELWSTRSFRAVYALSPGVVCVEDDDDTYVEHERRLGERYFGTIERRFVLRCDVAGFDHGSLTVLERVLLRLALVDHWLEQVDRAVEVQRRDQRELVPRRFPVGPLSLARTSSWGTQAENRLLRNGLDDAIDMLSTTLVPEITPLEHALARQRGLEGLVDQLDRRMQAIDEATRHQYERAVNERLTVLTVVTIVLAAAQVVVAVLAIR